MPPACSRLAAITIALLVPIGFAAAPAAAQGTDPKPADPAKAATDGAKPKKIDEFAEVQKMLGGPAANAECVWLGRRVVSLLWRDDLDTAFRHIELYDRFGCPSGHIQSTFRCVVRQGSLDPKATETLHRRVHACWIDPESETPAVPPAAAAPAPATTR